MAIPSRQNRPLPLSTVVDVDVKNSFIQKQTPDSWRTALQLLHPRTRALRAFRGPFARLHIRSTRISIVATRYCSQPWLESTWCTTLGSFPIACCNHEQCQYSAASRPMTILIPWLRNVLLLLTDASSMSAAARLVARRALGSSQLLQSRCASSLSQTFMMERSASFDLVTGDKLSVSHVYPRIGQLPASGEGSGVCFSAPPNIRRLTNST